VSFPIVADTAFPVTVPSILVAKQAIAGIVLLMTEFPFEAAVAGQLLSETRRSGFNKMSRYSRCAKQAL